jgi:hypothetical protein
MICIVSTKSQKAEVTRSSHTQSPFCYKPQQSEAGGNLSTTSSSPKSVESSTEHFANLSSWTAAHEWKDQFKIQNNRFVDKYGRTIMLRGVNLCGNSKLPMNPPGSTHLSMGFYHHRQVSFIGRPFPLSEADEHFQRLK